MVTRQHHKVIGINLIIKHVFIYFLLVFGCLDEESSINEFSLLSEPSTSPKENSKNSKSAAARNFSNGAADKNSKVRKRAAATGRGRPRKALVAMYHSQISGDKNTIKIRIKKSNLSTHTQVFTIFSLTFLIFKNIYCFLADAKQEEKWPTKKAQDVRHGHI